MKKYQVYPKETALSNFIRDFRAYASRRIGEQLEQQGCEGFLHIIENSAKNLPKQQYRVWKDDDHPVALISKKWFNLKMRYMHNNPVRKGFVEKPEHWKYSSARNWFLDDDGVLAVDQRILLGEG